MTIRTSTRTARILTLLLFIAATVSATVAVTIVPAAADPAGLTTTEVSIPTSGGRTLGGTVYAPHGATGKLPGLVLVHGSGNSRRESVAPEAVAFARQGIAVLAYDKRPLDQPAYSLLADDVLAAVDVLRRQPGVDPTKVGLWGISEGGWVMPIAAGRSSKVAFLVLASASALSPIRAQNWNMRNKLAKAGVSGALAETLSDKTYRLANDGGLFPEADYDPSPALSRITQPVLAVYGTTDIQVPPAESAAVLQQTIKAPLTVRFIPGAGHMLRVLDATGMFTDKLFAGYPETVGAWIRAVTAGDIPASHADPAPVQRTNSVAMHRSAWWESWPAQLATLGLLLASFLAYPVIAAARKIRRRTVVATRPARTLAATGGGAVIGFVAYLVYVHANDDWKGIYPGPMIAGRPIVWLALQAVALTTVIAAAMTFHAWRTAAGDRLRLGLLLAGGTLFLPWALYWGLLLP